MKDYIQNEAEWFESPLTYKTNKPMVKSAVSATQLNYNIPLFGVDLSETMTKPKCTKQADIGQLMSRNNIMNVQPTKNNSNPTELDYLHSMLQSLKPNSTHYTVRVYFNNLIDQEIQPLIAMYNNRNNTTTTTAAAMSAAGNKLPNLIPLTGLLNQGVTCYLNTYLQALYNLPLFRKYLFNLPIMNKALPITQCTALKSTTTKSNKPRTNMKDYKLYFKLIVKQSIHQNYYIKFNKHNHKLMYNMQIQNNYLKIYIMKMFGMLSKNQIIQNQNI
eukprot:UN02554